MNPNANDRVSGIGLQADGKILVGGDFTTIGGQPRSLFARLSNDTAALQQLTVTQTTVNWMLGGSSPQFRRVPFEYSSDNVTYTPLGDGTESGSNWTLTGLNLPSGQNFYVRARGLFRGGGNKRLRQRHGIRAQCVYCRADPYPYSDAHCDINAERYAHSDSYPYSDARRQPTKATRYPPGSRPLTRVFKRHAFFPKEKSEEKK